jgi:hypothetical protein
MVIAGWTLSAFHAYSSMGIFGGLVVCACLVHGYRSWKKTSETSQREFLDDLSFPPFLILLSLISLAGILYRSTVLDSLSYRIPRMLMWLQEDRVLFIDNPDARLNFMTPLWEFASTPVFLAFGFHSLWVGSALSWIMLYLASIKISSEFTTNRNTCRWLAMIPCSASCFALQAASTMNDGWAAAFLAISLTFVISFCKHPTFAALVASGMALSLTANSKPHFAVFALPWLAWFFIHPSRPWRHMRWKWLLPLLLVACVCSPLPTFVSNSIHYGNFKGPAGDGGFGLGPWYLNMTLGSVMMLWQMFQMPVNPAAGMINRLIAQHIDTSGLGAIAPRFKLAGSELAIVDNASLGVFISLIFITGIALALKHKAKIPCWVWWSLWAFVICFALAVSQVVPSTLGRSFSGFLILAMPPALAGISTLQAKTIKFIVIVPLAFAALAISISPSHPLWPAKTFAKHYPGIADKMGRYFNFQDRAHAGRTLMDRLPSKTEQIGILAVRDQSLIELWGHKRQRRVKFFPRDVTIEVLRESGIQWFVTAAADPTDRQSLYGSISAELESSVDFEEIKSDSYVCISSRGAELWKLYCYNPQRITSPKE